MQTRLIDLLGCLDGNIWVTTRRSHQRHDYLQSNIALGGWSYNLELRNYGIVKFPGEPTERGYLGATARGSQRVPEGTSGQAVG